MLFAGWRKRGLIARLLAGLGFRLMLVFVAGEILRRRRFPGHFLHWP